MCGCVLVWGSGFPQYAKDMAEYEKNRRALETSDSWYESSFSPNLTTLDMAKGAPLW